HLIAASRALVRLSETKHLTAASRALVRLSETGLESRQSLLARTALVALPPHDATWPRIGVFAVLQHLNSVDQHVAHSGRILVRLLERSVVLDRVRIEHNDVCVIPRCEPAASLQAERLGGKS